MSYSIKLWVNADRYIEEDEDGNIVDEYWDGNDEYDPSDFDED